MRLVTPSDENEPFFPSEKVTRPDLEPDGWGIVTAERPTEAEPTLGGAFPPEGEAGEDSERVNFPHFEPLLSESDEGMGLAGTPDPPQSATKPVRSKGMLPGMLLALVLLQAVPSFLWVQGRLATADAILPGEMVPGADTAASAAPAEPPAPAPAPPAQRPAPASTGPAKSSAAKSAPAAIRSAPAATGSAPSAPTNPALVAGRLAVSAPVAMHIYSRGKVVGTTAAETVLLPVGGHDLEFVSEETGYRTRQTVSIQAGRTSSIRLEPPLGTLHVNALPWAEVWIDNQRVGETPIGNLKAPIGVREVLFRHPELGERKTTVLVTLKGPARVSMDLSGK